MSVLADVSDKVRLPWEMPSDSQRWYNTSRINVRQKLLEMERMVHRKRHRRAMPSTRPLYAGAWYTYATDLPSHARDVPHSCQLSAFNQPISHLYASKSFSSVATQTSTRRAAKIRITFLGVHKVLRYRFQMPIQYVPKFCS